VTLTLSVETSSIHYGVALSDGHHVVAHRTVRRTESPFPGIGGLAANLLTGAGCQFADLKCLAVNVGPGNLGSVRAGVAYVNGLAFSLHLPIVCIDSLTLLAGEVASRPVLCLRNAGSGNVYAGLFHDGRPAAKRHGPLVTLVPELVGELKSVAVVGAFRGEASRLLPGTGVEDTGIETSTVLTLVSVVADRAPDGLDVATPLTDSSPMFR
jgi:tRNA threonylcarbamoyl adenosine modification protein YeaZ